MWYLDVWTLWGLLGYLTEEIWIFISHVKANQIPGSWLKWLWFMLIDGLIFTSHALDEQSKSHSSYEVYETRTTETPKRHSVCFTNINFEKVAMLGDGQTDYWISIVRLTHFLIFVAYNLKLIPWAKPWVLDLFILGPFGPFCIRWNHVPIIVAHAFPMKPACSAKSTTFLGAAIDLIDWWANPFLIFKTPETMLNHGLVGDIIVHIFGTI